MSELGWDWLGQIAYEPAVALMEARRERLLGGDDAQRILLLEHPPVITLGRHAQRANVISTESALRERGVQVVTTQRGGDVTYHGPGQLMIYPVMRVRPSVEGFLQRIAGVLCELATEWGVANAAWQRDPAGVWVGAQKLAACGLHLAHGISIHGFAFNLATPAAAWEDIVPCGLQGHGVVSLADARRAVEPAPRAPLPTVAEFAQLIGPRLVTALSPRGALPEG